MGWVGLQPARAERSIPTNDHRKVRIEGLIGERNPRTDLFLMGALLSIGEATAASGIKGRIVFGDDVNGIELVRGSLWKFPIAGEETLGEDVTWHGVIPVIGRSNPHVAGYVSNDSGLTLKFQLIVYLARWER